MPNSSSKQVLRLIQRRSSPDDALFQANEYLSSDQPEEAVKCYTEVLYKSSPASICAFLNRSLAYATLQMPELAVVDAYRAGMVANQMRQDEDNGQAKYQAAINYLRTEKLHVDRKQTWANSENRFIQGECWYSALSSLVLNDLPESKGKDGASYQHFSLSKRTVVCVALEIRAIYRLCAALYQCGGGARANALGLIDDAMKTCRDMEVWEKAYFQRLGNLIMSELMQPWDDGLSDPQGLVSMSKGMRRKQEEEKQRTKESMKAKTTQIRLLGYHWDVFEPALYQTDWQKLLQSWVHKSSSNCDYHLVESEDTLDGTTLPYAELLADRDISAEELVLAETTTCNATTSIPEDVFEDQNPPSVRRFYCDTCASLLLVPGEASVIYKGTKVPLPTPSSPSPSPASTKSSPRSVTMRDAGYDGSADGSPELPSHPPPESKSAQRPSSPRRSYSAPAHSAVFMFCCPTHDTPTCSAACRIGREPFDRGLCHTSTERELRNTHLLDHTSSSSLADRKTQCLRDLLFLRILAKAFNSRSHPLQDPDLVLATCGPNHQGAIDEERTWSFISHVVRPIHYLSQFFDQTNTDQFAHLGICDGWMINTLLSKIATAMRVSPSPRYTKLFNRDGNLFTTFTPFNEMWDDVSNGGERPRQGNDPDPEPWKDKAPWIASIHPIFNMIRIADPAKSEVPNVVVVQREGIQCYAISQNGLKPTIMKGEPLIRAADDEPQMDLGGNLREVLKGRGVSSDCNGDGNGVVFENNGTDVTMATNGA